MKSLFGELEPIRPEYRDRDARLAVMDTQGMEACWLLLVDLPEPVGPVNSTRPCCNAASLRTDSGRPISSKVGMRSGMRRGAIAGVERWWKAFPRTRATPPPAEREVDVEVVLERQSWRRSHRSEKTVDFGSAQFHLFHIG